MFGRGPVEVEVTIGAPKQKECGVFVIAVCTSLAYYYSQHAPLKLLFNQNVMRDHLIQCYINKCMTIFP